MEDASMSKDKNLKAAVRRTAEILEEHMSKLPAARAKRMSRDIHQLAMKASRKARKSHG